MDKKLETPIDIIDIEESQFDELGSFDNKQSAVIRGSAPSGNAPIELNDENITQEQINEMKMLGMARPEHVSYQRWFEIQDERYEHTHMIQMAAGGRPQSEIARVLGYDQAHVSKILNTPWVKAKVREEAKSIYGKDWKQALKDLNDLSIMVVKDTLENGKEAEKAAMAKWNLEHTVGKASQEIQVTKTTLTEFIVRVDQMKADQLRDVGSSASQLPKIPDAFDTIIAEVIPKGMVIGKRSSGNEG